MMSKLFSFLNLPHQVFADYDSGVGNSGSQNSTIGSVELPEFFKYGGVEGGLGKFLNNIFILISVGAGLFALFNFFRAGYTYIAAKKEPEKIEDAMAQIVNSLIGLLIVAAAFLIAALAGQIFFGDATFILQPKIYGPGQ